MKQCTSVDGPRDYHGVPRWLSGKESACNAGDKSLIPGLGRSLGAGNGNLLQYACLEIPVDRGAWSWTEEIPGVTKSQTQLNN